MTESTHQWRETIEELKQEPLSEGIRDYLRKFFTKRSGAPVPPAPSPGAPVTPTTAKKYIDSLNVILNKHQMALESYIDSLNLRSLKQKMEELDFRFVPSQPSREKIQPESPSVKLTGAPIPFTGPPGAKRPATPMPTEVPPPLPPRPIPMPPGTPKKKKTKKDLPHNSIFTEAQSREWRPRIQGLSKVMADAYQDVLNYLLQLAKDSGYTPKNSKDIKSLVSEMKHFTVLDKDTLRIIRTKIIGFMMTYRNLEGWLTLFNQTHKTQLDTEKKAIKKVVP